MRIGIDCHPLQSRESRLRGIGRYALGLTRSLLGAAPDDAFLLYARSDLPDTYIPTAPNAERRPVGPGGLQPHLAGNPDRLDALLLLSPHESNLAGSRCRIPHLCAVVYDLIPARMPEQYFRLERYRLAWEQYLDAIAGYDRFLAISEATRQDFIRLKQFDPARVVTVRAGIDPRFVPAEPGGEFPESLRRLGIRPPYILHVGGEDPRKGALELLDAYARLPYDPPGRPQLVYAYDQSFSHQNELNRAASARAIGGNRFIMTGEVTDEVLLALYQHAAVHCLPSKAEGLGLPHLEAMACGVPTIGGNEAAQAEVIGSGGLLVDPTDPRKIAAALHCVLSSFEPIADRWARCCIAQAATWRWDDTAARALEALRAPARRAALQAPADRPPLAVFGPLPPIVSGVAPYTAALAEALNGRYDVTVFRDPAGPEPEPLAVPVRPISEFDRGKWPRRLYQVGNSTYHAYLIDALEGASGVVTLHDLNLSGLAGSLAEDRHRLGGLGERLGDVVAGMASGLVVHSACNVRQLPDWAKARATVIPFGARPLTITPELRRLLLEGVAPGLSTQAVLVVGGLIHETKRTRDAVLAFAAVRARFPGWALLMVGPELDDGATRRLVERIGLGELVHWTGAVPPQRFADLMACGDLCCCLRRPPTNGETSGALMDALRAGVPCVVSDVGTFADLPSGIVRKTPAHDAPAVAEALMELCLDECRRRELGEAGRAHVEAEHGWAAVAEQYADAIERSLP